MTEPNLTSIDALRAAYAAGVRAEEVVEAVFARIAEVNDPGIFITLAQRRDVLGGAKALPPFDPAVWPLWGVPFAVKDNIDVAGLPTTAACKEYGFVPDADAYVVARLRAAGALVIGKTNLDQFATGLVGVRTPYPVPENAIDPALVPGGSSSGSAVAVARGIVPFSLGTDTAGSGRVPAAMNDIVGLKPSLGALSTGGVVPACRTLDAVSIFASSLDDAWRVFECAAGFDPDDPYSRSRAVTDTACSAPPARIGVPNKATRKFFGDIIQADAYASCAAGFARRGFEVVEVDFAPLYEVADMLYAGAWVAERYAAIADFMDHHEDAMHPVTAKIIGGARGLSAKDAFNGLYRLQALKRKAQHLLEGLDALLVPTVPTFYSLADLEADPVGPNSNLGTYTNFVNLLDMCGLAFPAGRRSDGLPFSATLLARGGGDAGIMAMARQFSGAMVETVRSQQRTGGMELAVVGAHLSGMPLNHELLALGATLSRKTRTAPQYRLFALDGTTPPKPGLLRVGTGEGASIEVEIWNLPAASYAVFVSAIPAPLGIGRIRLEDDRLVQGFLVEHAGIGGARDITGFGGWRNYCANATS
jgi:allophanate hydrolase